MAGKLMVVVGGQFGSEGKGAVAAHLSRPGMFKDGLAVRVAGPNAGHSAMGTDGTKYALRQVPVAAVVNPAAKLVIAAGSEIDPPVLLGEVEMLDKAGFDVSGRLVVDSEATIIHDDNKAEEGWLVGAIGSTGKGIGSARAARAMRKAFLAGEHAALESLVLDNTAGLIADYAKNGRDVLVEGTQGYGLGLHAGYYPKCTSSDCRAVDFLAMAGIAPWQDVYYTVETWVVFRPYPIRVAGDSGPLLGETTWEALGLPPEYTTVTKKVRRVGEWDPLLAFAAIRANGGPSRRVRVALTMADQVDPAIHGDTSLGVLGSTKIRDLVAKVADSTRTPVDLLGTGPGTIVDMRW